MSVGWPHRPLVAGYGGRGRGVPRLPSIEAMSAVSSPQTKAPAPMRMSTRNEKPVSKMRPPRNCRRSACLIAVLSRAIASGYSPRT